MRWVFLLKAATLSWALPEHVVKLPAGAIGLSTRGKALRVRVATETLLDIQQDEPKEVLPVDADATFRSFSSAAEEGIDVPGIGSVSIFKHPGGGARLRLRGAEGQVLTESEDLQSCAALQGHRAQGGRVLLEKPMPDEGACCKACQANASCTDWSISKGSCIQRMVEGSHTWKSTTRPSALSRGWKPEEGALAGRSSGLLIFGSGAQELYGRGAGPSDALTLLGRGSQGALANRATYVPYFYSPDGYAALGHSNITHFNRIAARYYSTGQQVAWAYEGAFQLYFMPAASLSQGTKAYYALTGTPAVPPRHILGFMACRWGWKDQRYLENTLDQFRLGGFPLDSVILDFEWFANTSDYHFASSGESWYDDFGWNKQLFAEPEQQLKNYLKERQVQVAGIRKPRLGNRELLNFAKAKGWLAPQGGPENYAHGRWLSFSDPEMRSWYAQQMQHYLDSGISYWWNDEGENFYYTYHDWNLAEIELHESNKARSASRFFSLNRAFTPGLARLGAAVWTGDVTANWEDLRRTPGMMLNWALAGAPYVACDIGGFFGNVSSQLLTRWYQVGSFMPLMRIHSSHDDMPHWPWLYEDAEVMRNALIMRYRLLPYHYSLAHRLHRHGELWIRPLAMDFEDAKVADMTNQWMDGEILVSPVLSNDSRAEIYLPAGRWHPFDVEGEVIQGPYSESREVKLGEVPTFVRLGTVLVLASQTLRNTLSLPGGDLEVQVYSGGNGNFTMIEDDGETTSPQRATTFVWDDALQQLSWTMEGHHHSPKGSFQRLFLTVFAAGRASAKTQSQAVRLGPSGSLSIRSHTARLRQAKSGRFHPAKR